VTAARPGTLVRLGGGENGWKPIIIFRQAGGDALEHPGAAEIEAIEVR
jgi:hypothetical protein